MTTIHVKSENYWCNLDPTSVELLRVAFIIMKSYLRLAELPFPPAARRWHILYTILSVFHFSEN